MCSVDHHESQLWAGDSKRHKTSFQNPCRRLPNGCDSVEVSCISPLSAPSNLDPAPKRSTHFNISLLLSHAHSYFLLYLFFRCLLVCDLDCSNWRCCWLPALAHIAFDVISRPLVSRCSLRPVFLRIPPPSPGNPFFPLTFV